MKFNRVFVASMLCTASWTNGAPAYAQLPPERTYIDGNSIDLIGGHINYTEPGISIGPADGGLEFHRVFLETSAPGSYPISSWINKYHKNTVYTTLPPGTAQVVIDEKTYSFNLISGVYQGKDPSTKLTATSTNYLLTLSDGTLYDFTKPPSGNPYLSTITHPSGMVETLHYIGSYPSQKLQSVTSSTGYQLHFETVTNGIKVTAINSAVDFCSPTAAVCTGLTQTWPTATFNGNLSLNSPKTDALGNIISYRYSTEMEATNPPTGGTYITRMTKIVSPTNVETVFSYGRYSVNGSRYVSQVSKGGASWSYSRTTSALPPWSAYNDVSAVDRDGAARALLVDRATGWIAYDSADGVTQTFTYGTGQKLASVAVTNGVKVIYTRDARTNITQTTIKSKGNGANGPDIITSATYDATCANSLTCNKPNTTTDALGRVTNYTYHAGSGGVATVTAPTDANGVNPQVRNSYTQQYAWYKDASGSVVQAATPVWRLAVTSACANGAAPACVGTVDELRTTLSFGSSGVANNLLPLSSTVQSGNGALVATTTTTYDKVGNPISVDGPLAGTDDTSWTRYDALGRVVGIINPDPDGSTGPLKYRAVRTTYNVANQVTLVEQGTVAGLSDPDWAAFSPLSAKQTTYDSSSGQVKTQASIASGVTQSLTQFSYDNRGRVECTAVRMNPAIYASLPASACSLGAAGSYGDDRIAKSTYTGGRLTKAQSGYGTADVSDDQTSTYTNTGLLATLKDAEANLTTYEYDGYDRLVKTRYPVGTKGANASSTTDYEQVTLNAKGEVTQRRLRDGQLVGYTYDNLGRVLTKDRPNVAYWETDQSFTYDLLNRSKTASDSNGHIISSTYDALGRKASESSNWYGMLTMSYDLADRRTRLTWPDGFYVDYDYDNAGAMKAIRENGATSGIGVLATYSYDDLGRRTGISRGNGTSTSYGYGADLRMSSFVYDLAGSTYDFSRSFLYNPAGQIRAVTSQNDIYAWGAHYNFDRNYASNGLNQYSTAGSTSLGYDGRGNLTSSGSTAYSYTSENQLATAPGGSFAHDPVGRLFYRSSPNIATLFDGKMPVLERDASSGAILRRFVHGAGVDEPAVWYEGSGTSDRRWLYGDERKSVITVADASGNALGVNRYDEFGIPQSGNIGRFQYTGQSWIPEVGMYDYKARIYSPTLGRFMQTDPIGYGDGMNAYAYVRNDPLNVSDPTGTYGRGAGWCGAMRIMDFRPCDQWDAFDRFQKEAADRLENKLGGLRSALQELESGVELSAGAKSAIADFEAVFGKGSATSKNINLTIGYSEAALAALRDDGSNEQRSHLVDSKWLGEHGVRDPEGAPAAHLNRNMFINNDRWTDIDAYAVGHESFHNSVRDVMVGNIGAYSQGTPDEVAVYNSLPSYLRLKNADNFADWSQNP